ncbi:hypothetical protein C7999DRAFT_37133 [Corynascus novoguineensis]|uniref:Actin-like ATPase domain-containing protein n=1 Tax=Corynascus novoguineensis TaxID=1126955 RepID=A0AAN7D1M8_9PEZI|nr:hypothetical protein C7999DRAFT_37133 [Corynascus novoguineensis]
MSGDNSSAERLKIILGVDYGTTFTDSSAETAEFDDPSLLDAAGSALFHIPQGKNAQMVCQDFLTEVYRFVVNNLKMRITPEVFEMTPMECYLTVPAIWTDKARTATFEAAKAAGFGSRPIDTIRIISEPEAAAVAALRKDLRAGSVNAVKTGDNVLILDCGGGTVDITTYTIRKIFPSIEFDEICIGIGGKCGSTYIDRNFIKLMTERFGSAFENVPLKRRGPGSEFMASFEKAKQSFGTSENESFEIHPIDMQGNLQQEHYDPDEAAVILSKRDMERVFDPVVRDVLNLLSRQVERISHKKGKRINTVVLVGGFGNSDYLKRKLDSWCAINRIKCLRLEGTMPRTLICRRHYGLEGGLPFRPGIDDEKHAFELWGKTYCSGRIDWLIQKGEELSDSTYKKTRWNRTWSADRPYVFTDYLYSCNLDSAPERYDETGISCLGTITTDFTNVDMSTFQQRTVPGGVEYKLEYEMGIDFRSDEGVLRCFCLADGKTIGVTTISFTDLVT